MEARDSKEDSSANSQDKTPFSYDNTTVMQGEGEVHHWNTHANSPQNGCMFWKMIDVRDSGEQDVGSVYSEHTWRREGL